MKKLTVLEQQQKEYADFLGSKQFPQILKQYPLSFIEYNKIFTAHVASVMAQSKGIVAGYINLSYAMINSDPTPTARFDFYFETSNNGRIETRLSQCSSSSVKIRNPQDVLPSTWGGRQMNSVLTEYLKQIPVLSILEKDIYDVTDAEKLNITIRFNHRGLWSAAAKNKHIWEQIIEPNWEVKDLLQFHFLSQKLPHKDVENTSIVKKHKI